MNVHPLHARIVETVLILLMDLSAGVSQATKENFARQILMSVPSNQ